MSVAPGVEGSQLILLSVPNNLGKWLPSEEGRGRLKMPSNMGIRLPSEKASPMAAEQKTPTECVEQLGEGCRVREGRVRLLPSALAGWMAWRGCRAKLCRVRVSVADCASRVDGLEKLSS
ncbi:hypothetical protein ACFE04_004935 [Oxalis oulophora]